jgi:hypothetical protein
MANTTSTKSAKVGRRVPPRRVNCESPWRRDKAAAKPVGRDQPPGGIRELGDSKAASKIRFSATLLRPAATARAVSWTFLTLPKEASAKLPSRGQTTVEGTLNGLAFRATLEPDGEGGHWLKVDRKMREAAALDAAGGAPLGDGSAIRAAKRHPLSQGRVLEAGDVVTLEIAPVAEEPEPRVPADLRKALAAAPPKAREAWSDITPAARRDFIHWITSPKRAETRVKRIETACDMLAKGKRRPCCFDRSGMYSNSLSCPPPQ